VHRCIGMAEDTLLFLLALVDDFGEADGGGWVEIQFMCGWDILTGRFSVDTSASSKTWGDHRATQVSRFLLMAVMELYVDCRVLGIEGCCVAPNIACICDAWIEEGAASFIGSS
jgi:hypothetical protein